MPIRFFAIAVLLMTTSIFAAEPTATAPASQPATATQPLILPGKGLAEHPFLYCGQTDSRREVQTIYLVRDGKIAWTYEVPNKNEKGVSQNLADLHMLSNGNILFARKTGATEITQDKKVVWSYDCPTGSECHSVQPIGLDKVFLLQPGNPAKALLINKATNAIEMEHVLETKSTAHGQMRHGRITSAGTYLIPHMDLGTVVEYDKDWKPIWTLNTSAIWAAVRLPNGNTLLSGNEKGFVREVNAAGETVWEITKDELPGITLHCVQQVERLANGNTLICNWTAHLPKTEWPGVVQIIEVTREKKVVWALNEWGVGGHADLGPGSCIQLLDEAGAAEKGELLR